MNIKANTPSAVATNTMNDRSLLFTIPMIPVTIDAITKTPASSMDIAGPKLLKSKVSPPRNPNATSIINTKNERKAEAINPVDHLPKVVLGNKVICVSFSL
jgi:hypothetical protein